MKTLLLPVLASLLLVTHQCALAQLCPSGPYAVGTAESQPPCLHCEEYDWGSIQRHDYTEQVPRLNYGNYIGTDDTHYHDQWLDLYTPSNSSGAPLPVYVFAHAGGQFADDAFSKGRDFCEAGIAFISWESVQSGASVGGSYYENDPSLLMTVHDYWEYAHIDFDLVLHWIWAHAEEFNLDTANVFCGGGSRGSRISFKNLDDPEHPVKGVFMTQAFADADWFNQDLVDAQGCPVSSITEFVGPDYPPMVLHYKNNLGDVLNTHDPLNGMAVMEIYDCYDIPARMVYGLGNDYQWPEAGIDFIQNFDSYFNEHPESLVDSLSLIEPSNILLAPAALSMAWSGDENSDFNLDWTSNGWENNMLEQPYPGREPEFNQLEIRLGSVSGPAATDFENYCALHTWQTQQAFDSLAALNSFLFPESGVLNACELVQANGMDTLRLHEGHWYGIQVRNNLAPSSNYYQQRSHGFWTPWSPLLVFEGPCSELVSSVQAIDKQGPSFTVHPNPAKDVLTITRAEAMGDEPIRALITDLTGRSWLRKSDWHSERLQLDLKALPAGVYWLSLSSAAGELGQRIIKH